MLLITELVLARVKQEMDIIIKNSYFKLLANNITLSILEKFYLEKIENNIKADISFFHFLKGEAFSINSNKNMSITTRLMVKSIEDSHS